MLTIAALIGFAGNSLLCRMALGQGAIDAASFTTVRIVSGAVVLAVLASTTTGARPLRAGGSWAGAAVLLVYAVFFSFAYLKLGAGSGALILFGTVQLVMIGVGLWSGERPRAAEWAGLVLAFGGLAYLTAPGASAPDAGGAALMAGAGVAWAGYCILGRKSKAPPLAVTADNFVRAVPFALIIGLASISNLHLSLAGVLLAVASGAIASGVGYCLWYAALKSLSSTRAAIVQLSVPLLAAAGGVALLGEQVSLRLVVSGLVIIGGVALAITARSKPAPVANAERVSLPADQRA